jgi:peptidoglycan/LPS O-acetylase OafA/YrhL
VPGLAGGFVGVDVFFVISGYLITGILARLARAPAPSLADFYARRLRRLLPALLAMLAGSALLAMVLLAPKEQLAQVGDARAASVWLANLHYALGKVDYFGDGADQALFLHTWSLGVEEQFYLAWPLLIFLAFGAWRGGAVDGGARRARIGLAALAVAGLALAMLQTVVAPLQAYYLLPARFWQFATGGLVVLWQMQSPDRAMLPAAPARLLAGAGLAAVVACALWLDGTQRYPGAWALAPTLGTAAVLAAGFGRTHGVVGWLASAPMQWVGRHSYGWYLWHWPLLLLGMALVPAGVGPGGALALAVLALAVAAASLRWIEAPVRHDARLAARPWLTIGLALAAMATAVAAVQGWQVLARGWAARPEQARWFATEPAQYPVYARGCDSPVLEAGVRPCTWGPDDARRTVVLVGDSIGIQWFAAVRRAFPEPEWQTVVLTKSACPMVDAPVVYARIDRRYTECEGWRREALALVVRNRPDAVVVGSAPVPTLDDATLRDGSRRVLSLLADASPAVFVLAPTPKLPFDGPTCLARHEWRARIFGDAGDCAVPLADVAQGREKRVLAEAVDGLANVHLLDLDALACPGGMCRAKDAQGRVTFRDAQHLTGEFVATLGPALKARVDAALARPATGAGD